MEQQPRWGMICDTLGALAFFEGHGAPLNASADMKSICLLRDGEMVAAVVYEGFNGHNVWIHVAAEPGRRWMTREYLRYCFHYPFNELGVRRLSGHVHASNHEALRLNTHLGFRREAVLEGAAPDGGDAILMVMRREDCRFLHHKERHHADSQ